MLFYQHGLERGIKLETSRNCGVKKKHQGQKATTGLILHLHVSHFTVQCVCVAWCCVVELVCTYSWSLGVNYVRNTVAIGMNTELNQTFDPSDSLERLYMTELPIWVWKTIFSSTLIHDAVMDIVEEFLQLTRTAPWLQHKLLHSNTKQVFKTHMVQSIPQRELTKTPCGRCWGYDKSISFLT